MRKLSIWMLLNSNEIPKLAKKIFSVPGVGFLSSAPALDLVANFVPVLKNGKKYFLISIITQDA